ncbi:MAG: TonB-dependent receptor, partial [Haliea sp.]
ASHNLESGVELAVNKVDERIGLLESQDGVLTEASLFNQESTIEETRLETFIADTWQLRPDLLLESSVDLEFSEIQQQGKDVSRAREFFYARPRLVLRYDMDEQTQWRVRIERAVSQLDFGDFVTSFTNDDNRFEVISAGNPELEPEKAWQYELTYERRFADDLGFFSMTVEYADISDRSARIPLLVRTGDGEEERTAPGNIGDAESISLALEGSLRLDRLGLAGAVLNTSVELVDSNVTDPFTGMDRNFNFQSDYEWSLGFRHDTAWRSLAYGIDLFDESPGRQFDLDFEEKFDSEPGIELFAETQLFGNLTLRLSIEDPLRSEDERNRLQFSGNRDNGLLERREFRTSRSSREISLTVQGVF